MKLEPLYRIRFAYPESWMVRLEGGSRGARLDDPERESSELVIDVAELIWEPIAD